MHTIEQGRSWFGIWKREPEVKGNIPDGETEFISDKKGEYFATVSARHNGWLDIIETAPGITVEWHDTDKSGQDVLQGGIQFDNPKGQITVQSQVSTNHPLVTFISPKGTEILIRRE